MIQKLYDSRRSWAIYILAGIIILLFAMTGAESYFVNTTRILDAAEVNGDDISMAELNSAISNRRQMLQQQFSNLGMTPPADMLSDTSIRPAALRDLINRRLISQAVEDGRMTVPPAEVNEQIMGQSAYQSGGQFSQDRYRGMLMQIGHNHRSYSVLQARFMAVGRFMEGLQDSNFITEGELAQLVQLLEERRSYAYMRLSHSAAAEGLAVSDADIAAHYEENPADFMRPETVQLEYISLARAPFYDAAQVDEDEVQARFQLLVEQQPPTRYEVAHILIEDGEQSAGRIAELQQKLDSGEDFAALAASHSDDLASSEDGGRLGYTSGDIFPPAFEAAVAELDEGAVSGPVATDSGTHFIKLLSMDAGEQLDFGERAPAIRVEIREELADEQYQSLLADISDAVYAVDSMEQLREDVPELADHQVLTSAAFSRQGSASGPGSHPEVVREAFADAIYGDGAISAPIATEDGKAMVIRVATKTPSDLAPLDEVRDDIEQRIRTRRASEALAERAAALIAQIEGGTSLEDLAARDELEWQLVLDGSRADGDQINRLVFGREITGTPERFTQPLGNNDLLVVDLRAQRPGTMDDISADQRQAYLDNRRNSTVQADLDSYLRHLYSEASISIKVDLEGETLLP